MLNEMTKVKSKKTGLVEYHFGGVNKRYLKRPAVIVMQKWDKKGGWSLFVWNPILGDKFKNDPMAHAHFLRSRHEYLREAKSEARKILKAYPNHERDCET
jgi:hypothetical protein